MFNFWLEVLYTYNVNFLFRKNKQLTFQTHIMFLFWSNSENHKLICIKDSYTHVRTCLQIQL